MPRSQADSINLAKFQPLFLSFHYHLYKMDERRRKILVALVFFMAVRHVMVVVVILQKIALHEHYVAITLVLTSMVAESSMSRGHKVFGCMTGVLFLRIDCYLDVIRLSYSNNIQGCFQKLLIICAVFYLHH